jgi:ribosomal protein L35
MNTIAINTFLLSKGNINAIESKALGKNHGLQVKANKQIRTKRYTAIITHLHA